MLLLDTLLTQILHWRKHIWTLDREKRERGKNDWGKVQQTTETANLFEFPNYWAKDEPKKGFIITTICIARSAAVHASIIAPAPQIKMIKPVDDLKFRCCCCSAVGVVRQRSNCPPSFTSWPAPSWAISFFLLLFFFYFDQQINYEMISSSSFMERLKEKTNAPYKKRRWWRWRPAPD